MSLRLLPVPDGFDGERVDAAARLGDAGAGQDESLESVRAVALNFPSESNIGALNFSK